MQRTAVKYHLIQLHYVRMTKLHQGLNLFLADALVPLGVLLFHALDSDNFT